MSHLGSLFCKNSPGKVGTAERNPPWAFKKATGARSALQAEGWALALPGAGASPRRPAACEGPVRGRGPRAGFTARLCDAL